MNYIMVNDVKIELTDEQIKKIVESYSARGVKLSDIPVGETFKVDDYEFIVLEHSEETTVVILKDTLHDSEVFGSNNKYTGSNVDELCEEFGKEIEQLVGTDNLILHTVDLTANDGLKDYGEVERKMSLLTAELYRRYVEILDKYKLDKWWWLSTPWSTPTHGYETSVLCVSPSGDICNNGSCFNNGVRPFCILKSNIFVSK